MTSLADAGVVVNGIVHAADVLEDAALSLHDVAKFKRVLNPKPCVEAWVFPLFPLIGECGVKSVWRQT